MVQMDTDVTEIAKRMATRNKAQGRVLLGTAVINDYRRSPGGFVTIRNMGWP
jgi:hypothetical protein